MKRILSIAILLIGAFISAHHAIRLLGFKVNCENHDNKTTACTGSKNFKMNIMNYY